MRLARMSGLILATLAVSASAASAASAVSAASAKTLTLHYFARQVSVKLSDRRGHPVNPKKPPTAGEIGDEFGLAYRGDHRHHAKRWTASFHLRCVFRSGGRATCDGQIAIGGSMLLLNAIPVSFGANSQRLRINAGTGVFQRAHGTLTAINVGSTNDSDFTIRVQT